jgi:hypothetical protein
LARIAAARKLAGIAPALTRPIFGGASRLASPQVLQLRLGAMR